IIREWFDRVKTAGLNPPRYSKIIYIVHRRTVFNPYISITQVDVGATKAVIYCHMYVQPNIAIWRGLTNVLFGKEIISLERLRDYDDGIGTGEPNMMDNGFELKTYNQASEEQRRHFWAAMLDLTYVDVGKE